MTNKQDTSVRVFSSAGHPTNIDSGNYALVSTVFQTCITGYGQVNIASVAVTADGVATVTTATAHNFMVGQVVQIASANTAALNDVWKIYAVPSGTTFTVITDFSEGAITGTVTVKVAPLTHLSYLGGNSFQFVATGKQFTIGYYSSPTSGTASLTTTNPAVTRYMLFNNSPNTSRWKLVANSQILYFLLLNNHINMVNKQYGFIIGNAIALPGSKSDTVEDLPVLIGASSSDSSGFTSLTYNTQIFNPYCFGGQLNTAGTAGGIDCNINPVTGNRIYLPIHLTDYPTLRLKGYLPGLYSQLGTANPETILAHGVRQMLHFVGASSGFCCDITGPWA